MRETFDKPPANGRRESEIETWSAPRPAQPPIVAGEVSMPPVLRMPLRRRFAAGWSEMVRQTAERFRVNPEGRLKWVPLIGLCLTFLLAAGSAVMAYGVWHGRVEQREQSARENHDAVTALVSGSELRLTKAADELKATAREMRAELMGKIEAIDGKVDAIQGSVSTQAAELARMEARLDAANDDKQRLWQTIETYNLKLERLERQQRAGGPAPPNGG